VVLVVRQTVDVPVVVVSAIPFELVVATVAVAVILIFRSDCRIENSSVSTFRPRFNR